MEKKKMGPELARSAAYAALLVKKEEIIGIRLPGRRILFLDDDPDRHLKFTEMFGVEPDDPNVVTATTVEQTIWFLDVMTEPWDIVSLDHDLGGKVYCESNERSGFAVAEHIAKMPRAQLPKHVILHSWHEKGVENMYGVLAPVIGVKVAKAPFDTTEYWDAFYAV